MMTTQSKDSKPESRAGDQAALLAYAIIAMINSMKTTQPITSVIKAVATTVAWTAMIECLSQVYTVILIVTILFGFILNVCNWLHHSGTPTSLLKSSVVTRNWLKELRAP